MTVPGKRRSDTLRYECPWDDSPYAAVPYIALDTETEANTDLRRGVPRLALATVSNGHRHIILHPCQLARFIVEALPGGGHVVCYNARFDYWVVRQALEDAEEWTALGVWDSLPATGRLRDAMILDFLVRLADPHEAGVMRMRNLGQAAEAVLGVSVNKQDPFRLRFGELIGADWSQADPGFFSYAIKDAAVTHDLYAALHKRAIRLSRDAGTGWPEIRDYGPLTELIQVRADLVLAEAGRNGMALDPSKIQTVKARLEAEIAGKVQTLKEAAPDLFRYFKMPLSRAGQVKVNAQTGTPQLNYAALRRELTGAAVRLGLAAGDLPRTEKTAEVATGLDWWRQAAGDDPFVRTWAEMADLAKTLQFVVQLQGTSVHPDFRVLVRTGRTSCTGPNIQQMPREPWFRELFVARPGHLLVIVDYSAIELRTLAAVLLDRYGASQLAEVIKGGRDPHAFTASMVLGVSYEDFLNLKKTDPSKYKQSRQAAKAINFGVPGGLGAPRLAAYAKLSYGVDMDVERARELREALITKVYPELSSYLGDGPTATVARNLHTNTEALLGALRPYSRWSWRSYENVIAGKARTAGGKVYDASFRVGVWDALAACNHNPALARELETWDGGEGLRRRVFGATVTTRTGRVRAGTDYGEARNTPFQGLAADGAKVALWELHKAGYRVINFVHDEIVCEVPEAGAEAAREVIERIMVEAMQQVIGHGIPVEVEGCVSKSWTKG